MEGIWLLNNVTVPAGLAWLSYQYQSGPGTRKHAFSAEAVTDIGGKKEAGQSEQFISMVRGYKSLGKRAEGSTEGSGD